MRAVKLSRARTRYCGFSHEGCLEFAGKSNQNLGGTWLLTSTDTVVCAPQGDRWEQCSTLTTKQQPSLGTCLGVCNANLLHGTIATNPAPNLADAAAGLRRQLRQPLGAYLHIKTRSSMWLIHRSANFLKFIRVKTSPGANPSVGHIAFPR